MVYLNGELVVSGDHYHADEWLTERFGVVVIDDEEGDCIPDGHHAVQLLAEAEENRATRLTLEQAAEAKREQARQLLAEADRMVGQ